MNIAVILQLIKEKDKMPSEQFDCLMQSVSKELNEINYSHKSVGGVDFELVEQILKLKSENQALQSNLSTANTSLQAITMLFKSVQTENDKLKEEVQQLKEKMKIRIIQMIKNL